jgi:hypothetical protein
MAAAAAAAVDAFLPSSTFATFAGDSGSSFNSSGAAWSHFRLEDIAVNEDSNL